MAVTEFRFPDRGVTKYASDSGQDFDTTQAPLLVVFQNGAIAVRSALFGWGYGGTFRGYRMSATFPPRSLKNRRPLYVILGCLCRTSVTPPI